MYSNRHSILPAVGKFILAAVAATTLAFCSVQHAQAGINDKPRTTCAQDMTFAGMFAHPSVSQAALDAFVASVEPGEKDQAAWAAIAAYVGMYQQQLGRDMNGAEVALLMQQVERQCYDAKGV